MPRFNCVVLGLGVGNHINMTSYIDLALFRDFLDRIPVVFSKGFVYL
jgi:hypothetical protein